MNFHARISLPNNLFSVLIRVLLYDCSTFIIKLFVVGPTACCHLLAEPRAFVTDGAPRHVGIRAMSVLRLAYSWPPTVLRV